MMNVRFKPTTLQDVLPFLRNKSRQGEETVAACPICESGSSKGHHLYLSEKNGKLLAYCQKCNAKMPDILKALGIKSEIIKEEKPIVIESYDHEYKNPDGSVAYYKHRTKYSDESKDFRFGYVDENDKTIFKKPPGCNNLYNLDLMEQASADTRLYIVEGEKCADAMVKHGLLATTSNTGAQKEVKLTETDLKYLRKFKEIVLIPDNDDKGMDYTKAWPVKLNVLNLKDVWEKCPYKGDVADYFAQNGDPQKIADYSFTIDYSDKTETDLIETEFYESIYVYKDENRRQYALAMAQQRAKKLGMFRQFSQGWNTFLRNKAKTEIAADGYTQFPEQPLSLKAGSWIADENGVKRLVQTPSGGYKQEYASHIPVMPLEILQNVDDGTEKIRIGFYKNDKWHKVLVPRSTIASTSKIIDLADVGMDVTSENAKLLVKYLAEISSLNVDTIPLIKSVCHFGWADDVFIPYTDEIKLDSENQYKYLIASVSGKGDLTEWINYTAKLRENLMLRLIMDASFASPIIAKAGALPFVLHLWGGTGSGKTVGMMVAASIWGNPRQGKLVRTMNMTINAMMQTASILKNLPFFGDELQTIKSRYENYDTLIMQVTEGINRGRMSNSTLQQTMTWENAFIFTGEEPCTQNVSGGGVKNRVIEIECTDKVVNNGNSVVNFISKHYGLAGQKFIEELSAFPVHEVFDQKMKNVLEQCNDTSEKQAMAITLILLADLIAGMTFYKDEDELTIDNVMPYLKRESDIDVAERAYREIVGVIMEHEMNFKSDTNMARWGRMGTSVVYVNKSVLVRELHNIGFNFNAVKKKWAAKGYLLKNSNEKYASHIMVDGEKSYYVCLKYDGM